MRPTYLHLWRIAAILPFVLVAYAASNAQSDEPHPAETITRDVCIIGGGSTGTYAAIRLKDQGKSVVVIEQADHLGGHAETAYFDGGKHIEYGVVGVFNNKLSRDYLTRLGAAYGPLLPPTLKQDYINFKTGQKLPVNASGSDGIGSLLKYSPIIEKYGFLRDGIYTLPQPIPEELLQPFGDFIKKHNLGGALEFVFTFASSVGDILETPLLYVLQSFGIAHTNALIQGYITPTQGFSKLYAGAAAVIGAPNLLFEAKVVEATRSDADGISVLVHNQSSGKTTRIAAKKLLITMPPTAEAMAPFDLDMTEKEIADRWRWQTYYASIVNNTGIPDGLDVANLDPNQPYSLPKPPFEWALQWMGVPGHRASKLIGGAGLTADDAKSLILSDLRRIRNVYSGGNEDPIMIAFADHTPTSMTVSKEDIKNGFYDKLYGLQGRRNTFYTGRSFCSDYSSLLWAYTDTVLNQMFS